MAKPTPAPAVLSGVRAARAPHAPFASMTREALERVVRASRIAYFAPGEVVLAPSDARPPLCYVIRQGRVRGERDQPGGGSRALWELGPGEMFIVRRKSPALSARIYENPSSHTCPVGGQVTCTPAAQRPA